MFDTLLTNRQSWLNGKGPFSDIVFSSRIRVARNLSAYPFPSRIQEKSREEILNRMGDVYQKIPPLKRTKLFRMEELSDLDRQVLLERHLISHDLVSHVKGKGVIISPDEKISLMINEEDHLRMQVISSGFDLWESWNLLSSIDDNLGKIIPFAFDKEFGFLTACPTNVGTALRASCMLHLPALILTKRINKILELLAKISFTTRGLFGEGTQALGNFFQVSNQVSLGVSEQEIIDNLSSVVNQVKEQEIDARNILLRRYSLTLEDNVWRAAGILKNSRLIDTKEALGHLSMLSLGLDLGIIKNIDRSVVNSLFIMIQPAHLQKIQGRALKEDERDYMRATLLRERLKDRRKTT